MEESKKEKNPKKMKQKKKCKRKQATCDGQRLWPALERPRQEEYYKLEACVVSEWLWSPSGPQSKTRFCSGEHKQKYMIITGNNLMDLHKDNKRAWVEMCGTEVLQIGDRADGASTITKIPRIWERHHSCQGSDLNLFYSLVNILNSAVNVMLK